MDEGQFAKLEALTAKYASGGSPAAYVNSATQMVGQVGTLFHKLIVCTYVRVRVSFFSFFFFTLFFMRCPSAPELLGERPVLRRRTRFW